GAGGRDAPSRCAARPSTASRTAGAALRPAPGLPPGRGAAAARPWRPLGRTGPRSGERSLRRRPARRTSPRKSRLHHLNRSDRTRAALAQALVEVHRRERSPIGVRGSDPFFVEGLLDLRPQLALHRPLLAGPNL